MLTATQALLSERYATYGNKDITIDEIATLTSMKNSGWKAVYQLGTGTAAKEYKIVAFTYWDNSNAGAEDYHITWTEDSNTWSSDATALSTDGTNNCHTIAK